MTNENGFNNIFNNDNNVNNEGAPIHGANAGACPDNGNVPQNTEPQSETVPCENKPAMDNTFCENCESGNVPYESHTEENNASDSVPNVNESSFGSLDNSFSATQKAPQIQTPDYSSAAGERTYIGASKSDYADNGGGAQNTNSQGSLGGNVYEGSNIYGNGSTYGTSYTGYNGNNNGAPYGNNGQGENARPQSAGIRYDADRRAGNGSYTWNYSGSGTQQSYNSPGVKPSGASDRKAKSKNGTRVFIAVAAVFALVCTAVVSAVLTGSIVRNSFLEKENVVAGEEKPVIGHNQNGGNAENMVTVPSPSGNIGALTKQEIAKKCKPSSVGIETVVTAQAFYGMTYKTGGVGSGFILTEDGYIATNHHVIEGADSITVQLDDGTKYEATLVGSDSVTDLAVLKIEAKGLIPMEIGDSDKMVVGDSVIAIGTPAGIEFAGTVTDGIISAINRGVEITNDRGTVVKTMTLMQTNAAINPGNSGGPLINDRGEVIGINTLKLTSTYEGIGFSIPINSAVAIFNQLITDGKVSEYDSSFVTGNGSIGITNYVEISEEEAAYYKVPAGIVILQLQRESHAYAAGLKRYDTIIAFQGKKVLTVDELNKYKSAYKAGDEVTLTVYREDVGEVDITFKLDLMG